MTPEVVAPGAWASYPKVAAVGPARSEASRLEAPEAQASCPEAKTEGSMQPDSPEVIPSGAPPTVPSNDDRAQGFGQLRLNIEALRKRKVLPSGNGGTYRPLKQRKYIAKDE